jgi:hypothetical protein
LKTEIRWFFVSDCIFTFLKNLGIELERHSICWRQARWWFFSLLFYYTQRTNCILVSRIDISQL